MFFLASILLAQGLTCSDARSVIERIETNAYLSDGDKQSLIQAVEDASPSCFWESSEIS